MPASNAFTWSYSALKNYETCPNRYYHYQVLKDVSEPQSDELKSGYALHTAFEHRVKSGRPLPVGMAKFEPMLATYVAAPGTTYAEQKLALTSEFRPTTYFAPDVWFRTVIDTAKIRADQGFALILDWKTGKPKADLTQLDLMAATTFLHDPAVHTIKASLAFVGYATSDWESERYQRADLRRIWGEVLPRVAALKAARTLNDFPPKPGGLCRKYCAVKSCPHHGR